MTAKFQLVIDRADPEPLARSWVAALGYQFEPPPDGYDNWDDYWRAVGVSEDELGAGLDCIIDPAGRGPRIWFQVVPEKKTLKNRLHLDITVSGGRVNPIETRRRLIDAEAQRLEALGTGVYGPGRSTAAAGITSLPGQQGGPYALPGPGYLGWPAAAAATARPDPGCCRT